MNPPKWKWPAEAEPYRRLINRASGIHNVPANLIARMLWTESAFREDVITGKRKSSAGALGIAQFMPATAAARGVNPLDPASAIPGAAAYLRELKNRFGSWRLALMAYNWGQGNVSRALKSGEPLTEAVPRAVRDYANDILTDVFL